MVVYAATARVGGSTVYRVLSEATLLSRSTIDGLERRIQLPSRRTEPAVACRLHIRVGCRPVLPLVNFVYAYSCYIVHHKLLMARR